MWYQSVRKVFEDFVKPQDSREAQLEGATKFAAKFRQDLGLTVNENGRPTIREAKMRPGEFSLRGIAEAICGYNWVETLGRAVAGDYQVFEAGATAAMTPSNIPNVSAFLGSVSGLLDAALLEGFESPAFVIDTLVPAIPSKTRQKKLIGLGRLGDNAGRRNPGDPHPFAQFSERYVTTPETYNDALACAVTYEAVFYDQTGEVLERANQVGTELALRKEIDGFKVISGASNPYIYNGVAYNTFQTSSPWVNDHANKLNDWTDLNACMGLFSRMTDQETGNRIAVAPDTLLVSPVKEMTARYIQNATEVESQTGSGTEVRHGAFLGDKYRIVSSVYLDQVCTLAAASGGLALAQATADEYWWALKTDKNASAFVRVENWPFQVQRAAPNAFTMLNQKLLLAVFADQMHAFGVREPRFVVRNKPA